MPLLLVATGLCIFTLGVHGIAGQRRVVAPLMRADMDPFARGTLLVVWHMVTWTLAFACVALLLSVLREPSYALGVGALCAGYALLFAWVSQRLFGDAIHLPQWILLGGVSVFALAGSRASVAAANIAIAGVLGALGVVHVLWALGFTWPSRDLESLGLAVVGRKQFPSALACWIVAFGLFGLGLALVLPSPRGLRLGIAALFALRGSLGFLEPLLRSEIKGTPYLVYSRYMYTPLSLSIGAAIAGTA
ncbi:MAG: DUF3995 domain-containing protein [Myxococcota bacterium]